MRTHGRIRQEAASTATPNENASLSSAEFAAWLASAPRRSDEASDSSAWRRFPVTRVDLAIAAVLFVAALGARWPLIARGETLLHSDEAIVGLMAQDIAAGERFPVYFYGQRYMGALEAYAVAALGTIIDDPMIALRLAPALFFAALCGLQFLMLTRWFGRWCALAGAAVLIFAPPMIAQWTISARGGYIEILLWGSALVWSYTEWFTQQSIQPKHRPAPWKRFVFGLLLGSGFWINPSIMLFALPIALHRLVSDRQTDEPRPLVYRAATVRERLACKWKSRRFCERIPLLQSGLCSGGPFSRALAGPLGLFMLPLAALMVIIAVNALWYVHVDHGRVRSALLLGLLPRPISIAVIGAAICLATLWTARRTRLFESLRSWATPALPMIFGVLVGAIPAFVYFVRNIVTAAPLEPALPMGIRPLWTVGETLSYLRHGLPLLFGADPRPFLELVTIGRPSPFAPVDIMSSGLLAAANWMVLGALLTGGGAFLLARRRTVGGIFRLAPDTQCPVTLLFMGLGIGVALFLLGGASHDFNTIRYLIPLWAFVPGLVAAAVGQAFHRRAARSAVVAVCLAWSIGQFEMFRMIGRPHPLRPVADALVEKRINPAVADIFDAHILSFLTGQRCRVAEFDPFWSRLAHYRPLVEIGPVNYLVPPRRIAPGASASSAVTEWRYPGPPPPESSHPIRRKIDEARRRDPTLVTLAEPLPCGYERVRLRSPLPLPAP